MSTLVERAEAYGGRAAYEGEMSIVLVPAARTVEFCRGEMMLGNVIDFVECLYFHVGGGVEPSMMLSSERRHFASGDDFLKSLTHDAASAIQHAADAAWFEVGVTER